MRYLAAFALATLASFNALSQHQHESHFCGSDIYFEQQAQAHPELLLQRDREVSDFVENPNMYNYSTESAIHTIPVVVHVMYYNFEDSISVAQIEDAIDVVNEDYSLTNSDAGNLRAQFQSVQANMEFRFELAKIDPNGNATNGITYHQSDRSLGADDAIKGEYSWNNTKYLNIWVVNAIDLGLPPSQGTILGYAAFPYQGQPVTDDGIVIRHDQMGRIGTATSNGRTLTHEIGHWVNLLHPFNYGCSNGGDLVGDTPPVASASYGCDLTKVSCGQTTMIENFMDYADDVCANTFTAGQKTRAKACMNNTAFNRDDIASSSNLIATGVNGATVTAAPTANFTLDQHMICVNEPVDFTNLSVSYINATYNWSFSSGATTLTSTQENPSMTFTTPGTYTVTLTATNSTGTDTKTKTAYFRVVDPSATPYDNNFTATFENNIPNFTWMVIDDGDGRHWQTTSLASYAGSKSAQMPTFLALAGGTDILQSTPMLMDQTASATLTFRYAWAKRETSNQDRLTVTVSTDCGATWSVARIISSFNLSTIGTGVATSNFVPTSAQWAEGTVNLNNFIGADPIMIRFNYISDGGNNLYLDEIRTAVTVSVEENENGILRVYPNPAKDLVTVDMTSANEANWTLINMNGQTVKVGVLENGTGSIDVADLPSGMYMLQLVSNGKTTTERVIVE